MMLWLSKVPIFIGSTIFGSGIYMGYVELINMDTDTNDHINWFWCDWAGLLELLREAKNSEGPTAYWYQPVSSIGGWVIYLIGAVFYQIGNTSDVFSMSEGRHWWIVEWPQLIGGFCFF